MRAIARKAQKTLLNWESFSVAIATTEFSYIYSLDFGMTQKSDGFFAGGSPEFSFSQVQRIVEFDNGVELSSQRFKVGLGFLDSNRSTGVGGGRSKGGSRSNKGGENRCGLHFGIQQFVR